MGQFPQDFKALLVAVAVFEGLSGVLKSKVKSKCCFWIGFIVEMTCAAVQSAALVILVRQGGYSGRENAAAYITVFVDAVLLLAEARLVMGVLSETGGIKAKYSILAALFFGTCLTLSAVPIIMAKLSLRSLEPFKSIVSANLLLTLPLLSFLMIVSASSVGACGYAECRDNLFYFFTLVWAPFYAVALALGILILKRNENMSVTFLVISNLFPALLTFMSAIFLDNKGKDVGDKPGMQNSSNEEERPNSFNHI